MDKRVFIRIDDDHQIDQIDRIAESLRQAGMSVQSVAPIVGQITGSVSDDALKALRDAAESLGVRLVPADEDAVHRLPPEGSKLQ